MPSRVFPRLDEWAEQLLDRMRPPVWLESEIKQRVLLFLNHVLLQESSALDRLRRQQGRHLCCRQCLHLRGRQRLHLIRRQLHQVRRLQNCNLCIQQSRNLRGQQTGSLKRGQRFHL